MSGEKVLLNQIELAIDFSNLGESFNTLAGSSQCG